MSRNSRKAPPRAADDAPFDAAFDPVKTRERHDGWTPDKQVAFIEALAECACVNEAAQRVGMTATAAYQLRRRTDAQSFRMAWQAALDHAVERVSDAAFSRALNGVARPVFYQGEQVGERRYFDERLVMFILRYRDPVRYGAWLDNMDYERHPDGAALALGRWVNRVEHDAFAEQFGDPVAKGRPRAAAMRGRSSVEKREEAAQAAREAADAARRHAEFVAACAEDDSAEGGKTGGT